jgi:hypothetical protein
MRKGTSFTYICAYTSLTFFWVPYLDCFEQKIIDLSLTVYTSKHHEFSLDDTEGQYLVTISFTVHTVRNVRSICDLIRG